MIKASVIGIIVLSLILIVSGCQPVEVVCNAPYIKVGTSCCLDKNNNKICDKDETEAVITPAQEPITSPSESITLPSESKSVVETSTTEEESQAEKISVTTQNKVISEGVVEEKSNPVSLEPIGKFYSYTQNGYTLIVDDYTFDNKGEWGILKDVTFILKNNQGSNALMPTMVVEIKDKKDSKYSGVSEVDLSEWVEDGESIKRTVEVDLDIGGLTNDKQMKVLLREWDSVIVAVSFDINLAQQATLG